MADMTTLLTTMRAAGSFVTLATNPASQFGTVDTPLVGATVLPEQNVPENGYREESIRYRTFVANDATRYSPVTLKGNALTGSMTVVLADQDTGAELTGREFDILRALNVGGNTLAAQAQVIGWADTTLNRPLAVKVEVMRWQAMVDALVALRGANGYKEDVPYSDPAGHRVTVTAFSDNATDPMSFFTERLAFLRAKGIRITRIFWTTPVKTAFAMNALIKQRAGSLVLNVANGQVVGMPGAVTDQQISGIFAQFGLPTPEVNDEQYQTQTGTQFFLKRNRIVILGVTGRNVQIALNPDRVVFLRNTLGYVGIGRAAGQDTPGRVIQVRYFDNKPPRLEGEAWQTSLPVIQDPEAISVGAVTGIAP